MHDQEVRAAFLARDGLWGRVVDTLRPLRDLSPEGRIMLFVATDRLAGVDPGVTALHAMSLGVDKGLDKGAVTFEEVLTTADSPQKPARQSCARDWPKSQQLLRTGDFEAAVQSLQAEALPVGGPTTHHESLRLRGRILPRWDGSSVDRLVAVFHHGLGDAILFARYLPALRSKARHVSCVCSSRLRDLIEGAFPDIDMVAFADAADTLQRADAWAVPETLPHLTGAGYGRADWLRDALPGRTSASTTRIGLCWAGAPANGHDALRSIPLAELAPLLRLPGIEWHSLMQRPGLPDVVDHASELKTFDDTIWVIGCLDYVVTVDTAIANLCGALGTPFAVLVEADNDFRWGVEGESTPWFPSARVFRRRADESSWAPTVERVREALH